MDINEQLDEYVAWLRAQYVIKKLDQVDEITTPFVNNIGDRIRIYSKSLSNGRIQLTDDGVTLEDLELMGIEITPTRQSIINSIKSQFGIDQLEDVFSISGSTSDFPVMKQRFTEAITKINDLTITKKSNIENMFIEQVYKYLDVNDFGGLPHYSFEGKSGSNHFANYVIPKRNGKPMQILDFQNKISKNALMISAFKNSDIRSSSEYKNDAIIYSVIFNDEEQKITSDALKIAKSSDIKTYTWSDKDELLSIR